MNKIRVLLVIFCGIIVCAFMCSCFPPPDLGRCCNDRTGPYDDQTIGEYFGISSHPAPATRHLLNLGIAWPLRYYRTEYEYLKNRVPEVQQIVLGRANFREKLSLWTELARPRVPFLQFSLDRKAAVDRFSQAVVEWLKVCENEVLVNYFDLKELEASNDLLVRDFRRYVHSTDYRADLFINFVRARGAIESRLAERCQEKLSNLPEDPYAPANRYESPRDIGDQCLNYLNGKLARQFTSLTPEIINRAVTEAYQRFYMHQLKDLREGRYEYPESLKQLEVLAVLMKRANVPKDLRPSDAEWAQLSRRSLTPSTE